MNAVVVGIGFLVALLCVLFGGHRLFLAGLYLWLHHKESQTSIPRGDSAFSPTITIQLPIYNEQYVVKRLIDAVCRIQYPRHLLDIQVLDDSDDETREIIDALVQEKHDQGVSIQVLRRSDREGYKAGALQNGLSSARGEWLLIFDSDFVPDPNILKKSLPYLQNSEIGMIQFRWAHINRDFSLLTRVQALLLDGHFRIEHFARNRSGRFFNFNGTAGMWRKQCIVDSGGWEFDTLTEDMDLSYRAQMQGWKFLYVPDIEVPAELPIELSAFKSQQSRWAKGAIQTARKILPRVFRSSLPLSVKIESVFHMLSNLMYLMMPLMILLLPFVLQAMPLIFYALYYSLLLFSFLSVVVFYLVAAWGSSGQPLFRKLTDIPLLMSVGIGLCINNSRAVLEGFWSKSAVFVRTPKYNVICKQDQWQHNQYRIKRLPMIGLEVFFLVYLIPILSHSIQTRMFHVLPFLMIFITGFAYFVTIGLKQQLKILRSSAGYLFRKPTISFTKKKV